MKRYIMLVFFAFACTFSVSASAQDRSLQQGRSLELQGQIKEARQVWEAAIAARNSELAALNLELARSYSIESDWTSAAAHAELSFKSHRPDRSEEWFELASYFLLGEEEQQFKTMIERFAAQDTQGKMKDLEHMMTRVNMLAPNVFEDQKNMVQIADAVVQQRGNDIWYQVVQGATNYRAGNYQVAEQQFKALDGKRASGEWVNTLRHYWLAMTLMQLNNKEEAGEWLRKGESLSRRNPSRPSWVKDYQFIPELELLRREAFQQIAGAQPPELPPLNVRNAPRRKPVAKPNVNRGSVANVTAIVKSVIKRYDKNNDGKIGDNELAALDERVRGQLKQADANGDQDITKGELTIFLGKRMPRSPGEVAPDRARVKNKEDNSPRAGHKQEVDTPEVAGFPSTFKGTWYKSNGVPGFIHFDSYIMTGNRKYRILKAEKQGQGYRVIAVYQKRYYPFFFRSVLNDSFEFNRGRLVADGKNGAPGFASQKLAEDAKPGGFQLLRRKANGNAATKPRPPFPANLMGTWYKANGDPGLIYTKSFIMTADKKFSVLKTEKQRQGFRVIAVYQKRYYPFFFRSVLDDSLEFDQGRLEADAKNGAPGFASQELAGAAGPWEFQLLRAAAKPNAKAGSVANGTAVVDSTVAQGDKTEGVYFVQSLNKIKLTGDAESPFAVNNDARMNWRFWTNAMWASAVLDNPGEVYLQLGNVQSGFNMRRGGRDTQTEPGNNIAIRLDEAADVTGTFYYPGKWDGPLLAYRFSIKADQFTAEKNDYLKVKLSQYQRLLNSRLTGAAWFRYQANAISKQLGQDGRVPNDDTRRNNAWRTQTEMDQTLSLVSGGMALSENLQLDRMLTIGAGEDKETFPVDGIKGITVTEFDWEPLVKDIAPKLDTLASYIPADQHAMFVPSFQSLVTLIETGFKTAGPLFPLMSQTTESANTRERYQKQLGLPLGEIQKMFGPKLIKSIAITGGDPYFRTGTDVAVLFEAPQPAALASAIQATIAMSVGTTPLVKKYSGTSAGVSYSCFVSPDRRVSSYVATLDNVVLVTNSLVQLNRIVEVSKEPDTALVELDEYRFFRNRHLLGDEQETALIVVTDQTIRRWCGPTWRIATSRRTRAAAVLSNLHARYLQPLADGMETPVNVDIGASVFALNQFTVADHAAISPTYGSLEFQTPVGELDIKKVSGREKTAYENWRRGYQSNWSTAFDPIAIRLNIKDGKLAADLTVMPLIDNSEYQSMADISSGAKLDSKRNSSHPEALTWLALALNTDSPTLKQWANMGSSFAKVNFMDWLGDAVSVYVDEDSLWTDLEKASAGEFDEEAFFQSNLHRLPIAIEFNVRSSIRLTAFLVGLRGVIEQAAPDMTTWETLRHRDKAYVKIGPTANSRRDMPDDIDANIALHYFASGDSLIFSLNELVIQRAIDRRLDKKPGDQVDAATETEATNDGLPLLGDNFAVQIKRSLAMGMLATFNDSYQKRMQRQSWSAIPILNQWKQLFPDRDPLDVDRVVWKRELNCPGGGLYRWNEKYKTMESSVYGHPAEPKNGPQVAKLLGNWETGNFGLTFENQGLRAQFELTGPGADQAKHDR